MRVGRTPSARFEERVRAHERPYTVHRLDSTAERWGESESESYAELDDTRDIYVYDHRPAYADSVAGDVDSGSLSAYIRADVDLRDGDRIDYSGTRYEVDTITTVQNGTSVKEVTMMAVTR